MSLCTKQQNLMTFPIGARSVDIGAQPPQHGGERCYPVDVCAAMGMFSCGDTDGDGEPICLFSPCDDDAAIVGPQPVIEEQMCGGVAGSQAGCTVTVAVVEAARGA